MSAGHKAQFSAKKQARLSQYFHKDQSQKSRNVAGMGSSKTINDTLHQQSIISQANGQLPGDVSTKESRQAKLGKTSSNASRPLTSNYMTYSGMVASGSKSSGKNNSMTGANFQHLN